MLRAGLVALVLGIVGVVAACAGATDDRRTADPIDEDMDGVPVPDDCDDSDSDAYPDAAELCDGIDNDCDGEVDEGRRFRWTFVDEDGDGYGSAAIPARETCLAETVVPYGQDCDDGDDGRHPFAVEVCDNGVDDDCDGLTDCEDWECQLATVPECGDQPRGPLHGFIALESASELYFDPIFQSYTWYAARLDTGVPILFGPESMGRAAAARVLDGVVESRWIRYEGAPRISVLDRIDESGFHFIMVSSYAPGIQVQQYRVSGDDLSVEQTATYATIDVPEPEFPGAFGFLCVERDDSGFCRVAIVTTIEWEDRHFLRGTLFAHVWDASSGTVQSLALAPDVPAPTSTRVVRAGSEDERIDAYVFSRETWVSLSYDPARDPPLVAGEPQIVGEEVSPTVCQTLEGAPGTVVVHVEVDRSFPASERKPTALVLTDLAGSRPTETRYPIDESLPWIEADDLRIGVSLSWPAWCVGDHDQDGRTEVLVRASLVFGPGNGRQDVHVVMELDEVAGVARAEAVVNPIATTAITPMDWDGNGVDDLVLVLYEQLAVFLARPAE